MHVCVLQSPTHHLPVSLFRQWPCVIIIQSEYECTTHVGGHLLHIVPSRAFHEGISHAEYVNLYYIILCGYNMFHVSVCILELQLLVPIGSWLCLIVDSTVVLWVVRGEMW